MAELSDEIVPSEATYDGVPESQVEQVPAYPKWEWECSACETTNLTEFSPPEVEHCDVCNHLVRTDAR